MQLFRKNLDKALEWTLFVLLSLLVLDVLWQVVSRYLMKNPSSFTDELAGFLLIWVGLLGTAYVSGQREHLAIDLLIQKSTRKRKIILIKIIEIITAVFAFFVLILGGSLLVYSRYALEVKSAALGMPLYLVYMVLPISGVLILFYALYALFNKEVIENSIV